MKAKAYLETSVWSRIVDREDPARRRLTRSFLCGGKKRLRWFISAVVQRELARTVDERVRRSLSRHLRRHRPRVTGGSSRLDHLVEALIARGVGSHARIADLRHVAAAMAARMDYLVSWDVRHLANRRVNRLVREFCREREYNELRIGTPEEVLGWSTGRRN